MLRELLLPLGVVGILASMLVPLPSGVIDVLLVGNLVLAVVLLASALYLSDPVKLSSLPTILLLATLYRLALNISTTRLILGSGDAGEMIETFGQIAIQGNVVVGTIVFLVITLVQFIVIAKGSERVAEVSARFTLDALPGKQMSIDADVRSGLIDIETAKKKREDLQIESRFYGALDGAMKFVKGDAIAGLAITAINVIGGFAIGVLIGGLDVGSALQKYTLLTIGDGLLSQIPALLNSLAAGMVVTRVVSDSSQSLASEVISQLGRMRKARGLAAGVAIVFALTLGPSLPFLALAGALLGSMLGSEQDSDRVEEKESTRFEPKSLPLLQVDCPADIREKNLAPEDLERGLHELNQTLFEQSGLLLPPPLLDVREDDDNLLTLKLRGIEVASRALDDTYGCPELMEALTELISNLIDTDGAELVDDVMTRRLLDALDREAPELVAAAVPGVLTLTKLTCVLRELVREGITVRNLDSILQVVAEKGESSSFRGLMEEVRVALARRISATFSTQRKLSAWLLDPFFDLRFVQAEQGGAGLGASEMQQFFEILEDCLSHESPFTILSSKRARRLVYDLCVTRGISVNVLAHEEIVDGIEITELGWLSPKEGEAQLVVEQLAA